MIEFQYDAINRLIHKIYIGKDQQIDYSYDDAARPNSTGMLTGVADLSGTTDFWYDESGRPITVVKTSNGVTGSFTIERDYDAFGRMVSMTYPDSAHEVVAYGYDQAGNLSSAGVYAAFSDYNALGQPGKVDYGNGVDTLLQYYDGTIPGAVTYRLQSIKTVKSGSNRQWIEYAYDNNGNLTDITDHVDLNRSGHYIYHYMDLLTTAQVKDPAGNAVDITMGYGRTGNITSNSRLGAYTYYTSRPNAVRAAGSNTYNYDANGNMTTRITGARSQSMVFDHENRLASITEGANRNDYLYDYTGARVKKVSLVSGVTSTTVYIGGIYEQKDGVNIKHIFAGSRRVASRKGSSTFYFHPDHLGSLSVVTNAAGESKQTATYYPFGETRDSTGPEDFDYKFTGQENDPETGLYYYGARYYDPEIGRFISPDSIVQALADPQTLNRYSYCRNNPLLYTDPTGHIFGIDDALFSLIFAKVIFGVATGGLLSASMSAITGGDLGQAALTGMVSGGLFAGAGGIVAKMGLTGISAAAVHAGTGMVSGAINAGITGGDVLQSAAISGISAGIAKYASSTLLPGTSVYTDATNAGKLAMQGGVAIATGTVVGGVSSAMMGGDFGQGAAQGAFSSAFGFLFNQLLSIRVPVDGDYGGRENFFDNQTEGSVADAAKTGLFLLGGLTASAGAFAAGEALVVYAGPYAMSAAGTELGQLFLTGLPDYLSAALPGTAPMPNIPGGFGFGTGVAIDYIYGQ